MLKGSVAPVKETESASVSKAHAEPAPPPRVSSPSSPSDKPVQPVFTLQNYKILSYMYYSFGEECNDSLLLSAKMPNVKA